MTVTGMTQNIQTHTCFAVWKQKLLNVCTIILRYIILILILDFYLLAALHFIEILVTGMTDHLSD